MILNLWDSIQKIADNFKDWIIENSSPVLMIALFLGGLLIFSLTWTALHKND
jgi:hypothetical protein